MSSEQLEIVTYSREFLDLSWHWLNDPEIKKLTGKQGADVIIETSGFADALQSALRGRAPSSPYVFTRNQFFLF